LLVEYDVNLGGSIVFSTERSSAPAGTDEHASAKRAAVAFAHQGHILQSDLNGLLFCIERRNRLLFSASIR